MRWQDSGFNTEDCSWMGIQFRNLKADKIALSVGIWPKKSFWTLNCAPSQKGLKSLSTPIGCEQDFFLFHLLLPGCHGTFSWMLVSQHPWQVLSATHSRTSSRNTNSWTTGEVLDLSNMKAVWSSVFSLPLLLDGPQISSLGQNGPLVLPNEALPDVFRSAGVFNSRHISPMNLATYTRPCNKNHVRHISDPSASN